MSSRSALGGRQVRSRSALGVVLRVLTAAALVVDAVVHLRLAGQYSHAGSGGMISEGTLFRVEAVAAIVAALLVLAVGNRVTFAFAFLVAASALVVVLLYRYVNIPAFGPIPSMYEPVWFRQKTVSAIAEGAGAVLAAIGLGLARGRHRSR